jgi:undecaprenyl diphosphate synthase
MTSPQHVAIIMDGNGRWAQTKGLSRIEGHKEGIKRVREIIDASIEFNLKALTLYVFSMENWNRPKSEVNALMDLLSFYLDSEMQRLAKKGIRFRAAGKIGMFSRKIQNLIRKFEINACS